MNINYSIIIPVYNGEKTIRRCIESILHQEPTDYEIIVVNDGSTDKTTEILCQLNNKYAEKIVVLNIENKGVSYARNLALRKAKGTWILFIDSDDYWTENLLQTIRLKLPSNNHATDLIIYNYNEFNETFHIQKESMPLYVNRGIYPINDFLIYIRDLKYEFAMNVIWNKVYKRQIITKFNIAFDENIKLGEDAIFNYEYMKKCSNIIYINEYLYNYSVENKQSLCRKKHSTINLLKSYYNILKNYDNLVSSLKVQINTNERNIGYFISIMKNLIRNYEDEKQNIDTIIEEIRFIFPKINIQKKSIGYFWKTIIFTYNNHMNILLKVLISYKSHKLPANNQ